MRLQAAVMALLSLTAVPSAPTEETAAMIGSNPMLTYHDVRKVAPALEAYTQNRVLGRFGNAPALGRVVASSHWQPLIAYERLQSAHFKEYKITTEKMAKSLKLVRTGSAWRKGKVMSMFHLHRLFLIILVAAFASSNALASEARGLVTIGMQRVLNT